MDKLKKDWNGLQLSFLKICLPKSFSEFVLLFLAELSRPKRAQRSPMNKKMW